MYILDLVNLRGRCVMLALGKINSVLQLRFACKDGGEL